MNKNKKRQYSKEAIDKAVDSVLNEGISVRQAAKIYSLPKSTIQFKIKNPDSKFKSGPDPILTAAEEDALCNFILDLEKRGFPRKKEDIQLCVQSILKKNPRPNPFKNNKPGEVWFKAFLKRHPVITTRSSEGVTNASSCVSEDEIRKWFRKIKEYLNENRLTEVIEDPKRIFNADETNFNICPITGKVLVGEGEKKVFHIEKGSAKKNITVLFTFSACGFCCDPLIIYPYKRIPDKVMLSVPSGWDIGQSETGLITESVFYDYIVNCFHTKLLSQNIPFPVILFVDGHKTHVTIEVSELCRSLNIHLIALHPHCTKILQCTDVAAFRPIKSRWRNRLRQFCVANNYMDNLTKESFAPLLKNILEKTIKSNSLINGFRVCGLFPFNANYVNYSKCLASKQNQKELKVMEGTLSFKEFCDIVGSRIIQQCEMATEDTIALRDQNFRIIYNLWNKFISGNKDHNNAEDSKILPIEKEPEIAQIVEAESYLLDFQSGLLEEETYSSEDAKSQIVNIETKYLEKAQYQIMEEETYILIEDHQEINPNNHLDLILDEQTGNFITKDVHRHESKENNPHTGQSNTKIIILSKDLKKYLQKIRPVSQN